jgi:hypothetical protein
MTENLNSSSLYIYNAIVLPIKLSSRDRLLRLNINNLSKRNRLNLKKNIGEWFVYNNKIVKLILNNPSLIIIIIINNNNSRK